MLIQGRSRVEGGVLENQEQGERVRFKIRELRQKFLKKEIGLEHLIGLIKPSGESEDGRAVEQIAAQELLDEIHESYRRFCEENK
jgi:hypothetical protein